MKVRITFRSEVFVSGRSMREVVQKFEDTPLFSEDARKELHADFVELVSVENDDTGEDLMQEYD